MKKIYRLLLGGLLMMGRCDAQLTGLRVGEHFDTQIVTGIEANAHLKRTSNWRFSVVAKTDSAVTVRCLLQGYQVEVDNQVNNSLDSVHIMPANSIALELFCLLDRPFDYTFYYDGRVMDQAVHDLFESRIRDWHIMPSYAEPLRRNAGGFPGTEMQVAFHGDTSVLGPLYYSVRALKWGDVVYPALSEDFLTAVAMASPVSDALLDGHIYDSAKVAVYLRRFDPLFGRADFYKLIELGLAGNRSGALFRQLADSLLADKPIHLLNKATELLTKGSDPDSLYETLRYLSQYKEQYRGWIQNMLAQGFVPMFADWKVEDVQKMWRENGMPESEMPATMRWLTHLRAYYPRVVARLVHGDDTVISNEVRPLYLWSEARKHVGNADQLLGIGRELASLYGDPRYGNSYRYGLMTYKLLAGGSRSKEAELLLDRQIESMTRNAEDTTNPEQMADRNMLAFAYKLKSEAVKGRGDTLGSDKYLGLAAMYSPLKQSERAYASNYDRLFLDSKESYRSEYAGSLIRHGQSVNAMRMISAELNIDPGILPELKKAFGEAYPGKDFAAFFNEIVVKSWKKAPSFRLTSPDGKKTYSLSDYRGKWLVLDFWGTWCGPCRKEMPDLNEFVQKEKGAVAFLSIACHDDARQVIKYFASQHYEIPSAMSDGMVEKNYGVGGYPTKFLISPAGTMMEFGFEQDWEKMVSEVKKLQPAAPKLLKNKVN